MILTTLLHHHKKEKNEHCYILTGINATQSIHTYNYKFDLGLFKIYLMLRVSMLCEEIGEPREQTQKHRTLLSKTA